MKICIRCKLEQPISNYTRRRVSKDGYNAACKSCTRKASKKHFVENREYYLSKAQRHRATNQKASREYTFNHLSNNPCSDCGEDDIIVLQFDHLNPKNKKNCVSTLITDGYRLETVKAEIEKCQVLCANCHARKTAKQLSHWKNNYMGC
jgi:hypothetical protein